jgi:hypothetical protein
MKVSWLGAGCSLLLVVTGCGSSTPAAATRVLGADAVAFSATPVCFVPPSPELSLSDRAQQLQMLEICQGAAREQGVLVVPFGGGQCLAATTIWGARENGDVDADCQRTFAGVECHASAVHIKSMKLVLARPGGGGATSETTAAIRSRFAGFSRESFHALCAAAFHDYPGPLSNAQFDVPVE